VGGSNTEGDGGPAGGKKRRGVSFVKKKEKGAEAADGQEEGKTKGSFRDAREGEKEVYYLGEKRSGIGPGGVKKKEDSIFGGPRGRHATKKRVGGLLRGGNIFRRRERSIKEKTLV